MTLFGMKHLVLLKLNAELIGLNFMELVRQILKGFMLSTDSLFSLGFFLIHPQMFWGDVDSQGFAVGVKHVAQLAVVSLDLEVNDVHVLGKFAVVF